MSADRVAELRDDILAGPEALERLLDAYGASDGPLAGVGGRPARVVFTGLGSSRYAALTAGSVTRRADLPAWTEYASTSSPTPPDEELALVAAHHDLTTAAGEPALTGAARLGNRHHGRSALAARVPVFPVTDGFRAHDDGRDDLHRS